MEIALVWAQARGSDGRAVIGRAGTMPWHLPEDLAHFKRSTEGDPVIMGRRTWESLPERFRPLPGRENFVVSRDPAYDAPGAEVHASLDAALAAAGESARVCVIGGGQLYRESMPVATELIVTQIDLEVPDADTFAPEIGPEWRLVDAGERLTAVNGLGYRFEWYRR